jgi:amidophosphoribosyltransferase
MRISSPPILWPCFYGIDMADRSELVAAGRSVAEIAELTGADSLAYLSLAGLQRAVGKPSSSYCRACFTGEYPIPVPDSSVKLRFEPGAREPAPA